MTVNADSADVDVTEQSDALEKPALPLLGVSVAVAPVQSPDGVKVTSSAGDAPTMFRNVARVTTNASRRRTATLAPSPVV